MLSLLFGVLLAAAPAPATAIVPNDPTLPLVAPGKTPDLDLVHTGDVIGFVDPCG